MDGDQFIADHVRTIGSSGIRKVFDLGATLKDPINLSIGQPDFAVPKEIRDDIAEAVTSGKTGYTVTRGLPALRERIAQSLKEEFDWSPDLFVTSGVSGGLVLSLLACVNPGEQVLFADPYFVSYIHLTRLFGAVPVPVSVYPDFQLHPDRFEAAITPKTKVILLASPSNPTGVVHREEDVKRICEIARERDLLILSDEIYNVLTYDRPSPSAVRYAPERTILLRGFSKSYAMTGLRCGFAAGPPAIIEQMAKLQQYTFVCSPHPVQEGAIRAMDVDMSEQVRSYGKKRDLVCDALSGVVDFVRPGGGFYVFPKVPDGFASGTEFAEKAIEHNTLLIPGEVFSEKDTHFRISYAAPDEKLLAGCEVIKQLASSACSAK